MTDRARSVFKINDNDTVEMETEVTPPPGDLAAFLPYACRKLGLEFDTKVTVVIEDEYVAKVGTGDVKKKKSTLNLNKKNHSIQAVHESGLVSTAARSSSRISEEESQNGGDMFVHLKCVVAGPARATVALDLDRNRSVPRELLSLLRLCASYHPLLSRFSARWCKIEPGALHELVALVPLSNISDVRLDDTVVCGDDCRALLDTGRLRCLSLARCQLGDEGCCAVAEGLAFPRPAARTLVALFLAGNAIGDAGALAIARALRSNRTLRLLDLADNQLRDEGGLAILRTLDEFPMTVEEIIWARRFRIECALRRCLQAVHAARPGATPRAMSARDGLGRPSLDHFPPEDTVQRGGHMYCRGNTMLNCLNLAYNSLSVVSLRALLQALRGQAAVVGCVGGLMRVQLDGNPLPACAPEYEAAAVLLERALISLETTNKQQLKKKIVLSRKLTGASHK